MAARERFIQDVLTAEGRKMLNNQSHRIDAVITSRTGNLTTNRRIQTTEDRLSFSHPIYERYLDMKRRHGGNRRRKSRKIHNRYVFGAYASIAARLMYGFTEEVAEQYRQLTDF